MVKKFYQILCSTEFYHLKMFSQLNVILSPLFFKKFKSLTTDIENFSYVICWIFPENECLCPMLLLIKQFYLTYILLKNCSTFSTFTRLWTTERMKFWEHLTLFPKEFCFWGRGNLIAMTTSVVNPSYLLTKEAWLAFKMKVVAKFKVNMKRIDHHLLRRTFLVFVWSSLLFSLDEWF
jgi:hypothetical protein